MLTALLCSIPSFPGIYSIQDLLCSAASLLFQEYIPSRNCSTLQHSVYSRNLFYPGTALLCSIPYFPGIYSILELLCSEASRIFQESLLSRNCSALQHPVFSRNCSVLQNPVFSRNIYHPGINLLFSVPSFTGIHCIKDLLCFAAASCLFQESIPSRNCSALQHSLYSRNLFYAGNALLCRSILSLPGIYSIQELLCIYSLYSRNLFYPGTALLFCILRLPLGLKNCSALLNPPEI